MTGEELAELENPESWDLDGATVHAAVPKEKRGTVFSVRFDAGDAQAIMQRAEFLGIPATEYIRRLVLEDAYQMAVTVDTIGWRNRVGWLRYAR